MPNNLLIAFAAFLVVALVASPLGGPNTTAVCTIYAALWCSAASLGSAAWRSHYRTMDGQRWALSLFFCVMLYSIGLSAAVVTSPFTAVIAELGLVMGLLPAGYLLARAFPRAGLPWLRLWGMFRLFAAALASMAIAEHLLIGGRSYATMQDPNVLAGFFNLFLLTGFARLAVQLRQGHSLHQHSLSGAELLLLVIAQGLTGSLSGFLCLVVGLVPLVLFAVRGLAFGPAGKVVGSAMAILLLVLTVSGSTSESAGSKLQGISQHSSFTVRVEMAKASLAIYSDSPWYGSGLGSYKLHYPRYRSVLDSGTTGDLAHNDYVQFLQEGGPLLLGALLSIVALVLVRGVWLWRVSWRQGPTDAQLSQAGAAAALLAVLLHAGMNFIFYSSAITLAFGVLLAGLLPTREVLAEQTSGQKLVFGAVMAALLLVLLSTLGARMLFVTVTKTDCELHLCKELRSDPQFVRRLSAYLAGSQKTWIPAREYLINNNLQTEESQTGEAKKAEWRANAFREALSLAQDTTELGGTYVVLAEIIKRDKSLAAQLPEGLPTEVSGLYELALMHNPLDLSVRLQLATALRDEGNDAEAYDVLNKIMPYWNLQSWGDSGRMLLLSASIPLAVSLHKCTDAREMAEGLAVFVQLQQEAATKGVPLPPTSGLLPSTIDASEKVLALAKTCSPLSP